MCPFQFVLVETLPSASATMRHAMTGGCEPSSPLVHAEVAMGCLPGASCGAHRPAKSRHAMPRRLFARALPPDGRVCGIAPGSVAVEPDQEGGRAADTLLGLFFFKQKTAYEITR